jgi:hypothetical protein
MKTLYMLHIPKTGGLAVRTIAQILRSKNILSHPHAPNGIDDYSKFVYIHGHFGIKPLVDYPEIESACLVREPLDRVVSNFIWLLMNNELQEQEPYSNLTSIYEKMRYYLLEDEKYSKNNVITRFLSSQMDDDSFRIRNVSIYREDGSLIELDRELMYKEYFKDWFLEDSTSLEIAKSTVDKITILGVTEGHAEFMDKVFQWFIDNHQIDIEQEYLDINAEIAARTDAPYVNFSSYTDSDDTTYTTQSLKALLTQDDIDRIYANNSLDLELYNYAKAKLQ